MRPALVIRFRPIRPRDYSLLRANVLVRGTSGVTARASGLLSRC